MVSVVVLVVAAVVEFVKGYLRFVASLDQLFVVELLPVCLP